MLLINQIRITESQRHEFRGNVLDFVATFERKQCVVGQRFIDPFLDWDPIG